MFLRAFLRTLLAAVVAVCVSMTLMPPVSASTGDNQIENTLKHLISESKKIGGVSVENITTVTNSKVGQNAWERSVNFHVTDTYSSVFGAISLASGPGGAVGIATRSTDGGCTMTVYKDGRTTTWSMADVGKNCTGSYALNGPDVPVLWSDPVPPANPTGLVATPGDSVVHLSWTPPADLDLTHYEVLVDGVVSTVQVPHTNHTVTITGLVNYTTYTFQVRAVDKANNVSLPSNRVPAMPVDLTAPGVPQNLVGTADDTTGLLSWEAVTDTDLASYKIYQNGVLIATTTDTNFQIPGLGYDVTYRYCVSAIDVHDNESLCSNTVEITPVDLLAPAVPENLTGTLADTTASLSWDTVTTPDLGSYNVYQDGVLLATTTDTHLSVPGLSYGVAYGYCVTSVDVNGNESECSNTVLLTPVDLIAPGVPLDLTGTLNDTTATLTWTGVTDADLAGYKVYQDGVLLHTVTGTSLSIPGLTHGVTYRYCVSAIDVRGNESACSNTVELAPKSLVDPRVPRDLQVILTSDSSLRASWVIPTAPNATYYEFHYSVNGGAWVSGVTSQLNTVQTMLPPETTYTYRVRANYQDGTRSEWTKSVSVTTPVQKPGTSAVLGQYHSAYPSSATDDAGNIYVTGGNANNSGATTARRWNVTTSTWENLPPMLHGRMNHQSMVDNQGRLFVFGGKRYVTWNQISGAFNVYAHPQTYQQTTEMYDPATNAWRVVANPLTARSGGTVARDPQGNFVVVGGFTHNFGGGAGSYGTYLNSYSTARNTDIDRATSSVERYNPSTNTWNALASLPVARYAHASDIDSQGRIYVVGGQSSWASNVSHQVTTYRYNPLNNTWASLAPISEMRSNMGIGIDRQDRVYIVGGLWGRDSSGYLNERFVAKIERFDPVTGTWSIAGNLPEMTSSVAVDVTPEGNLIIAGGRAIWAASDDIHQFNTTTDTLTKVGKLTRGRSNGRVHVLPNGEIHSVGGYTYNTTAGSGRLWNAPTAWDSYGAVTNTSLERYLPQG